MLGEWFKGEAILAREDAKEQKVIHDLQEVLCETEGACGRYRLPIHMQKITELLLKSEKSCARKVCSWRHLLSVKE